VGKVNSQQGRIAAAHGRCSVVFATWCEIALPSNRLHVKNVGSPPHPSQQMYKTFDVFIHGTLLCF